MKTRSGFVSNSSSTSFVIGKNYMTEEQQEKFRKWLAMQRDLAETCDYDNNNNVLYETYIGETTYYFIGEASQHTVHLIYEALERMGVDKKYAEDSN